MSTTSTLPLVEMHTKNVCMLELEFISGKKASIIRIIRDFCISDEAMLSIVQKYSIRSLPVGYKQKNDTHWKPLDNVLFTNIPDGRIQVIIFTNDSVSIDILRRVGKAFLQEIEKQKTPD